MIARVHFLDASIGSEELVNLPTKFSPYLPTKGNVGDFGDGNDYGDDGCKNLHGDVGYSRAIWSEELSNFGYLNDGVNEEQGVEKAEGQSEGKNSGGATAHVRKMNWRVFRA